MEKPMVLPPGDAEGTTREYKKALDRLPDPPPQSSIEGRIGSRTAGKERRGDVAGKRPSGFSRLRRSRRDPTIRWAT